MSDDDEVALRLTGICGVDDETFGIHQTTRQVWRHGPEKSYRYKSSWSELAPLPDGDRASEIYIHPSFEGRETPAADLHALTMKGKILRYNHWHDLWSPFT